MYDNETSTKSFEDAVIQACAGVEVIPQESPEGEVETDFGQTDCGHRYPTDFGQS